jgi:chromate transport protein ChrA
MGLADLWAVFAHYWDLGFTSFGGPGVHVVILRRRFVDKLKWVDETTFLDLFALGNALPGPGSTQLAFSIAVVAHGVAAGLLAFFLWSLPGAAGMAGLGVGVARIPDALPPIVLALFTGINAAAVGLIALAAIQLATAAATDRATTLLLWLSAAFGICYHAPWMYPTLIAAGGVSTLVWDTRREWWRAIRRVVKRPPQVTETETDETELGPVSSTPANVCDLSNSHRTRSAPPLSPPPSPGASGASAPTVAADIDPIAVEVASPPQRQSLKVVSPRVATALLLAFVLFLTVPLATRAGLQNAGREVPIALDVSYEARHRTDTPSSSATWSLPAPSFSAAAPS